MKPHRQGAVWRLDHGLVVRADIEDSQLCQKRHQTAEKENVPFPHRDHVQKKLNYETQHLTGKVPITFGEEYLDDYQSQSPLIEEYVGDILKSWPAEDNAYMNVYIRTRSGKSLEGGEAYLLDEHKQRVPVTIFSLSLVRHRARAIDPEGWRGEDMIVMVDGISPERILSMQQLIQPPQPGEQF